MSTMIIVGVVAAGLFILIAIGVTTQTIERNKKEKRRRLAGLTARARNFQYMLAGFPEGFLNKDLQMLVCKSLQQIYKQLEQLEPNNPQHAKHAQPVNQKLEQLKNKANSHQVITLTDTKQIQEVQKLLSSLFNFISKLTESKSISAKEGKVYAKQINKLLMQTSMDSLNQAKHQALTEGKSRLAIHYLQMGIEKMSKKNADGFYTEAIAQYSDQINELNAQALQKEQIQNENKNKSAEEWDELSKEDESWKKKAIYD